MKIRTYGMMSPVGTLGNASSWCWTIINLLKVFEKRGHELYINTTNGVRGIDRAWMKFFRDCSNPDIDINYTLPQNWAYRFSGIVSGTKQANLKLGVFNYESSILPQHWVEYHSYVDYLLPSSEYVRDIFLRAGIPDEKIVVMPLGVDFDVLDAPIDEGFEFKTKKKFKLLNISIPHQRKNIPILVDAFFEEFDADDDICLIIKTTLAERKETFELDVRAALAEVERRHTGKKLPEVILFEHRFNNMATIYKKCDALICVSASEGFWLPGLEGMYCGNLIASPRYSGQLDFLEHNKNSLLIDTTEVIAPKEYQYWQGHPNAVIGMPVKDSLMATMRKLYEQHEELHKQFDENMKTTVKRFTWDTAVNLMLDLYEGRKPIRKYGELL